MYRRARMGIGYLPQEASIFRGLTVEDNIRAVLEMVEPVAEQRAAQLDQLLAEFSLSHLRRAPALALSGGERRRVEIARALASRPSFILLDEPLAGIDPINVGDIRNLVAHLKDRGIGVLITDHNVRDTLDIIDRAYILHEGRVLTEGAPGEIVADEGCAGSISETGSASRPPFMSLSLRLDLRQSQTLVMTPQLQQAIKLLQLSNLELAAYVERRSSSRTRFLEPAEGARTTSLTVSRG